MSKKRITSRCLVIDASVAGAAGSLETKHPKGRLCRDFLIAVRSVCHRIAWTADIAKEWEKHNSTFAQTWRVSMVNLRKLVNLDNQTLPAIREAIEEHCDDEHIRAIVLKDCHLVDAALAADGRIVSDDEQVRGHFASFASRIKSLQTIVWVNPAIEAEEAVNWLEQGALKDKNRRLQKKRS